ncbi:unnamed protein product, partial [marine sediment metagenome]
MSSINNPTKRRLLVTGTYTGDNGDNRQITTGFKCSLVICICTEPIRPEARVIFIPNIV